MVCGVIEALWTGCEVSNNVTLIVEIIIAACLAIGLPAYFYNKENNDRKKQEKLIEKLETIITKEDSNRKRKINKITSSFNHYIDMIEESLSSYLTIIGNQELIEQLKNRISKHMSGEFKSVNNMGFILSEKGPTIRILRPEFFTNFDNDIDKIYDDLPFTLQSDLNYMSNRAKLLFEIKNNLPKMISDSKDFDDAVFHASEVILSIRDIRNELHKFLSDLNNS